MKKQFLTVTGELKEELPVEEDSNLGLYNHQDHAVELIMPSNIDDVIQFHTYCLAQRKQAFQQQIIGDASQLFKEYIQEDKFLRKLQQIKETQSHLFHELTHALDWYFSTPEQIEQSSEEVKEEPFTKHQNYHSVQICRELLLNIKTEKIAQIMWILAKLCHIPRKEYVMGSLRRYQEEYIVALEELIPEVLTHFQENKGLDQAKLQACLGKDKPNTISALAIIQYILNAHSQKIDRHQLFLPRLSGYFAGLVKIFGEQMQQAELVEEISHASTLSDQRSSESSNPLEKGFLEFEEGNESGEEVDNEFNFNF